MGRRRPCRVHGRESSCDSLIRLVPPQGVLYANQVLVELGAFRINSLRRSPNIEFYPWNPVSAIPKPKCEHKKPRPDGLQTAR